MRIRRILVALLAVPMAAVSVSAVGAAPQADDPNTIVDPALYQSLRFRFLGPYRGGRSGAVMGVPGEPDTFYLGASGGLYKTTNSGETWNVISDADVRAQRDHLEAGQGRGLGDAAAGVPLRHQRRPSSGPLSPGADQVNLSSAPAASTPRRS